MTPLLLIRHGMTDWNHSRRIQGQTDIPLSDEGQQAVRLWRLNPLWLGWQWWTSPLMRACQTAQLLGLTNARPDSRLTEMCWGEWEGRQLAALRKEMGQAMQDQEALGLDFRPPGGESPREVFARLKPFLADRAAAGQATGAICHKGVIRAVYAAAMNWDMREPPPHRLENEAGQLFAIHSDGTLTLEHVNIPLLTGKQPPAN